MPVLLSASFGPVATVFLVFFAVCAVAILFYLIPEIIRYSKVSALNASSRRDAHFASELLSVYLKKGSIIEGPYMLRSDTDAKPSADVIVVCQGGIIVLSVDDREGSFETPKNGVWTLRDENGVTRVPNLLERGMYYVNACATIAKRNGISCPIYNLVLLSNDDVEYDEAYGDGILACDEVVPCIRKLSKKQKITAEEAKRLQNLIMQNDSYCRKLFMGSSSSREKRNGEIEPEIDDVYSVDSDPYDN